MWTIIGYFIATGGTIVGAFYTYKQYKHSVQKQKLNPNASFILKKESQSQNTLERINNKPSSNNIVSNLNDNSDGISDLIRMLTRIKDDFDKVNFIANYTQNFERKFSAEEVYHIVSVFEDDFDRNNALSVLSTKIQRPISESSFLKIISTFEDDFDRNNAVAILKK